MARGHDILICDNDDKYGLEFSRVAAGAGIHLLHTPLAAPKANAFCERHLRRLAREYVAFYNHARPHQGLNQRIPAPVQVLEHPPRAGQPAGRLQSQEGFSEVS